MREQILILWDSHADPSGYAGRIYRWNGHVEKDSIHSLLRYVETHGERLRRKYLAWIHELGESLIDGKRLIDHLALEDGLSYWWMTLIAEKSLPKSPVITDAIRLLALEEIILQEKPGKLRLVSVNPQLHEIVCSLCQGLGVDYEWKKQPPEQRRSLNIKNAYQALPQPLQAIINLTRYVWRHWPLRHTEKSGWFGDNQSLFFCSYFFNISPDSARNGRFHSHYWQGLHQLMQNMGFRENWLHLYISHDAVPNPQVAMDWTQRFNQQRQEQSFHSFLEAHLTWRIVYRVIKQWLKLMLISRRLGEIKHTVHLQDSQLSLWPLLQGEWYASMRGSVAINNLLWIALFDKALYGLPHQKKGLYLCENQPWERALIHAWRKHGHGQLIAVAHSTVRFWDLRYFFDPRTIRSFDAYPMPQADLTALNGKAAVDAYLSVSYPEEAIVECEALRYGYLNDFRAGITSRRIEGNTVNVLILCDYMPSATIKMLQLLEAAIPHMSTPATYTIKPHPNYLVKLADYPSLHLKIAVDPSGEILPLGEILHDFDIAYSSNMTSAALDAYLADLPVVVVLNDTELNLGPLRGQTAVRFVSTPEELAEALQKVDQGLAMNPDHHDFFFLDPELPRWRRLLSSVNPT